MIRLPGADGQLHAYEPRPEPAPPVARGPGRPDPGRQPARTVFAAAHVVAAPQAAGEGAPAAVDWDATLAFRHHLWAHGLRVAEAMDTAQRGAGLTWPAAAALIRRSAAEARTVGGGLVCGVGTDHLTGPARTLHEVVAAYEQQLAVVEGAGADAVLLASRALAALARGADDYLWVYERVVRQAARPVVLHWLGPMFDPALHGYWGSADLDLAGETLLAVVAAHPGRIDGIKVSLLDADREVALRRRLPAGVRCYTGDDFHYPQLIAGDGRGHSDALLGVFDPLAPLAADAVRALGDGPAGRRRFHALLEPTVPLARHLFAAPTQHYKTGVVLLAWLAGHQRDFVMLGGQHTARSLPHLARAYQLADTIGLFPDPTLAEARMRHLLTSHGVPA
ncbi:DUF993 family protein [Streptomyces sp. 796.1]|uniref:DUF993 family protein n=1 Tax=Streptomyces sp. 796.1 TaxID=3163029 RepID=UPI0039C975F4